MVQRSHSNVEVSDGTLTATQSFTVTVVEEGTAPVLDAIGAQSVDELVVLTPVQLTATDADGDALTFSLSGAPDGMTLNGSDQIEWTPTEEQGPGVYNVLVTVTDSTGLSDSELVTFTVGEVNVAPALAAIGAQTVNEGDTLNFTAAGTDADLPAQTLNYSLTGTVPAGASIDPVSGVFSWTPGEGQDGSATFDVVVSDGTLSASETITITVGEMNQAPVVAPVATTSLDEDATSTVQVTASDVDVVGGVADELSYSLSGTVPGFASIDADGLISFTPGEADGPGTFTFDVLVSDGDIATTVPVTVVVNEVNVAPTLAPIDDATVNEGDELTFVAVGSDTDTPVQNLSYSLTGDVPAGATIDPTSGVFSFTPSETQGGNNFTFSVVVSDGIATGTEELTVTVGEVNDAPVLAPIANQSVVEGDTLNLFAVGSDADLPAQTLAYSLTSAAVTNASLNSTTGEFTFSPDETQGGSTFTFDVQVSDGTLTAAQSFTVTVVEEGTAPVLDAIGAQSVDELEALTPVQLTATDADGDALTFSLSGAPDGMTLNGSDQIVWTPSEEQGPGVYNVLVTVTDSTGLSDSELVTFTVGEVNVAPVLAAIGAQAVNEGDTLNFTAAGTDADLPAQTLNYSLTGTVPAGASIDPVSGVFSWTPGEGQDGSATFDVVVSDGTLSASETITITVGEVNQAPVVAPVATTSLDEDATSTVQVTASDVDVVGGVADELSYSLSGNPTFASIDADGLISFTPGEADGPGTFTFDVLVSDGDIATTVPVTVVVNEVNVAPTLATIDDATVNEGDELTFVAVGSDTDTPVQNLSYSLTGDVPAGATIDPTTGVFSFTPSETQGGNNFTFSVVVSDGVATGTEALAVTVNEVNDAPVLAAIADASVVEGDTLSLFALGSDSDLPAQTLAYSLTGTNAGLASIDPSTGEFTFTALESQGGESFAFTVEVNDGALTASTSFAVTVIEEGTAPVLTAIGSQSINELEAMTPVQLSATDADGDSLTFSLSGAPDGLTINGDNQIVWTPSEIQGPGVFNVLVTVTDTTGLSDSELVAFTVGEVNVAPVLDVIDPQSVNEGDTVSFTATATDSDLPANSLTFSLSGAPAGATINPLTGEFSWTTTESDGGTTPSFDVIVSDGTTTASETVTVTVIDLNEAPVLAPIGDQTASEGSLLTFTASASDVDVSADTLTFSLSGAPAGALIDGSTGVFTWTPGEADGGSSFTFDVVVSDGTTTDTETITVAVAEVNDSPAANDDVFTTNEDMPLTGNVLTFGTPDSDPNGDSLMAVLVPGSGPSNGSVILAASGEFTYTPDDDFNGLDSFVYQVSDGNGGSDTATVSITIDPVNDDPIAVADSISTTQDTTAVFNVLDNDTDVDLDGLTVSAVVGDSISGPGNVSITGGVLNFDPNGSFSFVPASGFVGTSSFDYTVSDGNGGTDTTTVNISVIGAGAVNIPPVAGDDTFTTDEDVAVSGENLLVANGGAADSDADGDTLTTVLLSNPSNGTASVLADGSFTYTPNANFDGPTDSFTYRLLDGNGGVDEGLVTININPVNDPADVSLDNVVASLPENTDTAATVKVADIVISDDLQGANTLSLSGADAASFVIVGTELHVASGVTLDFEAQANYDVTVEVDDADPAVGIDDSVSYTLAVEDVNEAPAVDPGQSFNVNENTDVGTVVGTVVASDPDVGQTLTYAITAGNTGSAFAIDPNTGEISVDGSIDFENLNAYTLTVTATDSGSPALATSAAVTISVNDQADEAGPRITSVAVNSTAWTDLFRDYVDDETLDNDGFGYSIPTGNGQLVTLPWININQILVEFDEDVSDSINLDGSDFSLEVVAGQRADGTTASVPTIIGAVWEPNDGGTGGRVVLTLSQSIDASIVRVVADDLAITDAAGNSLNGEWTDEVSTISGDTNPGGDFRYQFRVVPGDVVKSGPSFELVDGADFSQLSGTNGGIFSFGIFSYDRFEDLNGDNFSNGTDSESARIRNGSRLLADSEATTTSQALSLTIVDLSEEVGAGEDDDNVGSNAGHDDMEQSDATGLSGAEIAILAESSESVSSASSTQENGGGSAVDQLDELFGNDLDLDLDLWN